MSPCPECGRSWSVSDGRLVCECGHTRREHGSDGAGSCWHMDRRRRMDRRGCPCAIFRVRKKKKNKEAKR